NFLESYGYTILKAVSMFSQPVVCSPTSRQVGRSWEPTCYIATIDPERVKNCVRKTGWQQHHVVIENYIPQLVFGVQLRQHQ
ncbi:MAG: hypothetical protein ACKO9G_25780, partial [Dolichospermum sp.]